MSNSVEESHEATTSFPVHGNEIVPPEEEQQVIIKRNRSVVLIGDVGAGKSTLGGQILFLTGRVDNETLQECRNAAHNNGRDDSFLAYVLDIDDDARAMGNTIRTGTEGFETETSRLTILDALGLTDYVPSMIWAASQADVAVLVISARHGEFETGFEIGGQTREHVTLARAMGVEKMVVVINKMWPLLYWEKERFTEIIDMLTPFLRDSGYRKTNVTFLPISGKIGLNIRSRVDTNLWWDGQCLLEALDAVELPPWDEDAPLRMPIFDKFDGLFGKVILMGKVFSGSMREEDTLLMMPNNEILVGDTAILYIQAAAEECEIIKIPDPPTPSEVFHRSCICFYGHCLIDSCPIGSRCIPLCRIRVANPICVDRKRDGLQLGRFVICSERNAVAVGCII